MPTEFRFRGVGVELVQLHLELKGSKSRDGFLNDALSQDVVS